MSSLASVAKLGSERNFQILSEKNEERGGIFKLNLPTSDEFFAAEIWKLQLNLIWQQTPLSGKPTKNAPRYIRAFFDFINSQLIRYSWSERRELNPGLTHPKGKYYRYTTLRRPRQRRGKSQILNSKS